MLKPESRAQFHCKAGSILDFDDERFGQSKWQRELFERTPEARNEARGLGIFDRTAAFLLHLCGKLGISPRNRG